MALGVAPQDGFSGSNASLGASPQPSEDQLAPTDIAYDLKA